MSAIGSLLVTALATVGAVSVARNLKKRWSERNNVGEDKNGGRTIDMEVDEPTGVWKDPKAPEKNA